MVLEEAQSMRVLDERLQGVQEVLKEVQSTLRTLLSEVSQIKVIEQRLMTADKTQDRQTTDIADLTKRVGQLERDNVSNTKTSNWMDRVVWAMLAAVGMYVGIKTGLIQPKAG